MYVDIRISLQPNASSTDRNGLIETLTEAEIGYSVDSVLGEFDLSACGWHASLGELESFLWELLVDETIAIAYQSTPVVDTSKTCDCELERPVSNR